MQLYDQTEELTVIGVQVKTFPAGIKEAFDGLIKTLGSDRSFYGISWMDESNHLLYYAMATEAFAGEANRYGYVSMTINKGKYYTETIQDWLRKTDCIKNVFHRLMPNEKPDKNHPCIEWYKSNDEMICMFKPR